MLFKKLRIALCSLLLIVGFVSESTAMSWPNTPGGGRTYPQGLSSDFGPRGTNGFHYGLDFPDNSEIRSVHDGWVEVVNLPLVVIQDVWGSYVRYYHVGSVESYIQQGAHIEEGAVIGEFDSDHVDIKVESSLNASDFENPLAGLFNHLYVSSTSLIESVTLTGDINELEAERFEVGGDGNVRIDAYIETTTKDLDIVELSLTPQPPDSVFPVRFDYHSWAIVDGMSYRSYTDQSSPAEDHFYYNFDASEIPAGEYALNVAATDVNGNITRHELTLVIPSPAVESTTPEDSDYNVATDSDITITFDREMDIASVQSALNFNPTTSDFDMEEKGDGSIYLTIRNIVVDLVYAEDSESSTV